MFSSVVFYGRVFQHENVSLLCKTLLLWLLLGKSRMFSLRVLLGCARGVRCKVSAWLGVFPVTWLVSGVSSALSGFAGLIPA